ncbi:MAG: LamG-like jellyroll fold domain-containing protein [Bacteroidota bacterium]
MRIPLQFLALQRSGMLLITAVVSILLITTTLTAQDGTIDSVFGATGTRTTAIGSAWEQANSVALQSDGKIVVAGYSENGVDKDFAVVRYNSNGTLDATFNDSGKVTTSINTGDDEVRGVALQSDGKIVVAGYTYNGANEDFAVVRYNSDGTLDTSFDSDGIVTTDFGYNSEEPYNIGIQSDGKIVVVGYIYDGLSGEFAIARYNNDGSLDTSFNGTGKVINVIAVTGEEAKGIAFQSDGKIVVAGHSDGDVVILRYNTNGTLDTSFNSTGKVVIDVAADYEEAYNVALQTDGKIVVGGYTNVGSYYDVLLIRVDSTGAIDPTFDGDGIVSTDIGTRNEEAKSIAIQSDGKIVVAGYYDNGINSIALVLRYNSNGTLDNTFATNGIDTTKIGNDYNLFNDIDLLMDDKIVVVGSSYNGTDHDFAIRRYNSDGTEDGTFNQGTGKVITPVLNDSYANAIALQTDGKIIAGGAAWDGAQTYFAVARYSSGGILDKTFGTDGKVTTAVGSSSDQVYSIALQSDGKIIAAGTSNNGSQNVFAVVRYDTTGVPDNTFGSNGIVTTSIGSFYATAYGVAVQSDGKILLAGDANSEIVVVRYNSDGTLDTSFDSDGIVSTPVAGTYAEGKAIILQTDGKIVVVGNTDDGANSDFAVVRYNSNGSLDATFNSTGKASTAFGSNFDQAFAVAVQTDGKIVVGGNYSNGTNSDFAVARYNSNGTLDTTFSSDGKATTAIGSGDDDGKSIVLQSDGKIVIVGDTDNGADTDFGIVRFNSDGTLDSDFDGDGIVTTAIGSSYDRAYGVVLQTDDDIVVAGSANNESTSDFALVRYFSTSIPVITLSYSSTEFSEAVANDGSIDNASPITITLSGDTFTGSTNDNFVTGSKVTVSNLPAGLTAVVTRTSSTMLEITLTGNAAAHALADSVSNLTFTFQNTAFTGGNASSVINYAKNDLHISFTSPQPGNALQFDGINDVVQVPYSANFNPAVFTYEIWARVVGGEDTYRTPMSSRDYDGGVTVYGVHFYAAGNNNKWEGWIGKGVTGWSVITGTDIVEGEWTHLAQTYDGTTQRFYVNGVLQGSAVVPFLQNTNKDLTFGVTSDGLTFHLYGSIDEARIWNVVRTEQEIRENMHRTINPGTSNLVGYWQFSEGSGTTLKETNGYNGTLSNFDFDTTSGWVASTIPAATGTSASAASFTSGTANLGAVTVITTEAFDSTVNLTATELFAIPNTLPTGYASVISNKYYVVNVFSDTGTFTANLRINFGENFLDSRVDANPAGVKLFKRNSNSAGAWTEVGGAISANAATGDVTWSGITSFSQFAAVYEETALPVELFSLTASATSNGVELNWSTATEQNNYGFEIEKSRSQKSEFKSQNTTETWSKAGFVEGSGTTNSPKQYSFTDKNLNAGKYSYRLKQIDRDGKYQYSQAVEITISGAPKEFALEQNYPNPFNPSTVISYQLPVNSHIALKVYDVIGREVATLVNEVKEAGSYSATFDASQLSSGIYFARLQSGDKVQLKKMVLMK